MNIAIVCDYFLDFVGGAQTSMEQQRRALTAAGHRVTMVSAARDRGQLVQALDESLLVRPRFILPGVDLPIVANDAALRDELVARFRAASVDVVHVQTEFGLAHAAADAAAVLGIPVIHTVHTFYWSSEGTWHALLTGLVRRMLRHYTGAEIPRRKLSRRPLDNLLRNLTLAMALRATAVVSPSAHQARDLAVAGVTPPPAVVPNPVATSTTAVAPLTEEQVSTPAFLWVARCESVKRPLVFAKAALRALEQTGDGFSVDFVGDGSEIGALRRLAAGQPLLRVHGALDNDAVLRLMDASSAVVLSSLGFDNQPMTIAEAVSRERGILYCDPRLSEGLSHAGYLSATPGVEGLADALVALVEDPELLLAMSRGAAEDAAEFSAVRFVERILAVYTAAGVRR
ncbi:MAG TPA: glycosyltransferase family 4 protein [Terrimesophilobacter sp.]|uniref:glycosyltransferase family 4 protein n=1 Tax=Terrimesophilobacter sp. TaxID=2906435 RepID=UPI002F92EA07